MLLPYTFTQHLLDKYSQHFNISLNNATYSLFKHDEIHNQKIPVYHNLVDKQYVLFNQIINAILHAVNDKPKQSDIIKHEIFMIFNQEFQHLFNEVIQLNENDYNLYLKQYEAIVIHLAEKEYNAKYIKPEKPDFNIYDFLDSEYINTEWLPKDIFAASLSPSLSKAIDFYCYFTQTNDYRRDVLYDKKLNETLLKLI